MKENKYNVGGKELKCLYCGNNTFIKVKTLLNRRLLAMFDLEGFGIMGKKGLGTAYICANCGFKQEFFKDLPKDRKERIKEMF